MHAYTHVLVCTIQTDLLHFSVWNRCQLQRVYEYSNVGAYRRERLVDFWKYRKYSVPCIDLSHLFPTACAVISWKYIMIWHGSDFLNTINHEAEHTITRILNEHNTHRLVSWYQYNHITVFHFDNISKYLCYVMIVFYICLCLLFRVV
jgi:hypothetical protein